MPSAFVDPPNDLSSVTHVGEEHPEPEALGVGRQALETIWAAAEQYYCTGTQPALALCIRRRGQVVLDRCIGHARAPELDDDPQAQAAPATTQTPICIFSASKAITAMLVHLLDERRELHIDDPVAEYVPEFGANGKERTTLRHVLAHRAGVPIVDEVTSGPEIILDFERSVQAICQARPQTVPGRSLMYHALTGGFVLGEVIQRVTGKPLRTVWREEVAEPLGLAITDYGIPPGRDLEVATNYVTGAPLPFPLSSLVERTLGASVEVCTNMSNDPRFMDAVIPAGNMVSNGRESTLFMELMRQGGVVDGVRVFDRRTVQRALVETSFFEPDLNLFGFPMRHGLGWMLGRKRLSPFGPDTPLAFGHLGFSTCLIWADPAREISVAVLNTGKCFGLQVARQWQLLSAISAQIPKARGALSPQSPA